jgi:hypothetical protein
LYRCPSAIVVLAGLLEARGESEAVADADLGRPFGMAHHLNFSKGLDYALAF